MTVTIPQVTAEVIGLCHANLSAAREYARSISIDPKSHRAIQNEFNHVAADVSRVLHRLDNRIPAKSWEDYKEQIIEADPLRLDNIKQLYIRMLPAQREMLEKAAEAILSKKIVLEEKI